MEKIFFVNIGFKDEGMGLRFKKCRLFLEVGKDMDINVFL